MSRDEEIESVYVGGAKPSAYPIKLVEYDPSWPRQYEMEAARVRSALGAKVVRLEHVGSTSVPGLPAKPILDMVLVVADSSDEAAYVPAMEAAGFRLVIREPKWYEHRLFKGPGADVNLHVFSFGCSEIGRMLAFRDRLRASAKDRETYAEAKRELAKRAWKYVQHYADAKTEVIRKILGALCLVFAFAFSFSGCMPEVKNDPQPLPAGVQPSDLDACAMLPAEGDPGWYMEHVSKSLTRTDGRPAFHSLTFIHALAQARVRCDFVFQDQTTMDDINSWSSGYTARLGLYSGRSGRLLGHVALNVTGGDAELYHAMFRGVQKGTPMYAALAAERGR